MQHPSCSAVVSLKIGFDLPQVKLPLLVSSFPYPETPNCRCPMSKLPLGPPVALLPFFWGEGSPTKIDYRKEVGTLILCFFCLGGSSFVFFLAVVGCAQLGPCRKTRRWWRSCWTPCRCRRCCWGAMAWARQALLHVETLLEASRAVFRSRCGSKPKVPFWGWALHCFVFFFKGVLGVHRGTGFF